MFNVISAGNDTELSLTTEQMLFMLRYHNVIEVAYAYSDTTHLNHLAESNEFKQAFANISFDEACDRYQSTILDACLS